MPSSPIDWFPAAVVGVVAAFAVIGLKLLEALSVSSARRRTRARLRDAGLEE